MDAKGERMIAARRYNPTNTRFFTWILRHTYGVWARRAYRAEASGLELFDRIKPPFIVVGNHSMLLDPFLANSFIPHPIHWVTSDGNMRSCLMRFLLIKLVGSIPKSKAIPDIETVNWIVRIIRGKKGVVGIYPEGQTTWDGVSLPSWGSTAKLLKMLKAPVIGILTRGAYMSKPRWSYVRRPGRMELEFRELFSAEDLASLPVREIEARLNEGIWHNDPEWCRRTGLRFAHPKRAERLELALFSCPACGALGSMSSCDAFINCRKCGLAVEYGEDGSLATADPGKPAAPPDRRFGSVREWDAWQKWHLADIVRKKYMPVPHLVIFADDGVRLFRGKRMDTMELLGKGTLELSAGTLVFRPGSGPETAFPTSDIESPGVLKSNIFEFYVGKATYRVRFGDKAASARKYALALETLASLRADASE